MYQSVAPLKQGADHALFEPIEYASLGEILVVPVVAIEARVLAHHYPIVWRRQGDGYEMVALLSISAPHLTQLRGEFDQGMPRPLLIEAYPLAIAFSESEGERGTVLIDAVPAPEGATGTPVFLPSGAMSPSAGRRMAALQVYASDAARTASYTRALAAAGLMSDWTLRLRIGEDAVEIDGLCVLAPGDKARTALAAAVLEHGFPLAELVTFHDLSLFNMQRLVDRFRSGRLADRTAQAAQTGAPGA
ncbi:SapC family protein [Methylobacterium sp. sgz302541]|uniref:SapC family protein n=1 Tax=unclassified Methylobacterium TaxID=2615210 RepID=UPI003D339D42